MDHRAGRSSPLWEGGNVVSESGIVELVNENTKEGGGLNTGVGLKLRVDKNDEGGDDGRK